jgi:hypothetical protein
MNHAAHAPRCAASRPTKYDEEVPQTSRLLRELNMHRLSGMHLFRKVQVVPKPLPRLDLAYIKSRATIGKRRKEEEAPEDRS